MERNFMEFKIKFKKGDRVIFKKVTQKYGCSRGIVKESLTMFTDDSPLYPGVKGNKEVRFFNESGMGRRAITCYTVVALDMYGNAKEEVLVTEGFLTINKLIK